MKLIGAAKILKTAQATAVLAAALISATTLLPTAALADGGVVRTREAQGSFIVTVFSPPEIARDQLADVTVLVQRRESGEVVMDAVVDLSFTPPAGATLSPNDALCGPANNLPLPGTTGLFVPPASIPATRAHAANKLFYGATVVLRAVGDWQVRAMIRHSGQEAIVSGHLPVGAPPRRLAGLWPYLALPPLVTVGFLINQRLRRRSVGSVLR